ncbi:SDR family NAD(P)-dependent oxidoreductase [Pararhodobacter oceanensis]|uniref:SDR family NAD(P)-dependent oxidoreductase n=1 Tax=Pararhodobacter oceanensis TaxID=2172121 RepID=UPI003A957CAC
MSVQRVLIVGAAGGIGGACVDAFDLAGWQVIGADLNTEHIPSAAETHILDVSDAGKVASLASRIGRVDAVIYAAGIVATMPIADTDFSVWRRIMAVNLDGAAHVAKAFVAPMIAAGKGGSLVFLSSAAGVRGEAMASAYSASKAGLIGMTQSLAAELTSHAIRVNAVAPGNVDTPMLREVAREISRNGGGSEAEVWNEFAKAGAAQRLVTPQEVAVVCAALCSPTFSAVTGTIVPVDAGYLL